MARFVKASHFIPASRTLLGAALAETCHRGLRFAPDTRTLFRFLLVFPWAAADNHAFFFSFFSFEMNFPMKKLSANDFFGNANGTSHYHRYPATGFVYTDGIRDLSATCESYWLLDLIISYQCLPAIAKEGFQVWRLEQVFGDCYKVSCDDGNGHSLASQVLPFSDFPYQSASLWLIGKCLLLPNEY